MCVLADTDTSATIARALNAEDRHNKHRGTTGQELRKTLAMETRSCDDHGRRLTLVLSALALPTHLLSAIALQHLPSSPLHLAFNFSLYCIWAAALSALGLAGVVKRSPSLVTIFSHHLLFDALISTIPRILLIPAVASLPGTLCAGVEYQHTMFSPRDAEQALGVWTAERCRAALWVLQIVVGLVFVAMTGMQWWCALRVRGYAWYLEATSVRGVETMKRRRVVRFVDEEAVRGNEKVGERRVRFADELEKSGVGYDEDRTCI